MRTRIIAILSLVFLPLSLFASNPGIDVDPTPAYDCSNILITGIRGSVNGGSYNTHIFDINSGEYKGQLDPNVTMGHDVCPTSNQNGTMDLGTYVFVFDTGVCQPQIGPKDYATCLGLGALGNSETWAIIASSSPPIATTTVFRDTAQPDFDNMTGYKFDDVMQIPVQMVLNGIGIFLYTLNVVWMYVVGFIAIVGTVVCLYRLGRKRI